MSENQKPQTNGNADSQQNQNNAGDNGKNPAADLDEEELAKQIKDQQAYANVFIKAGEFEVSLESNENLEDTTNEAIRALTRAKVLAEQGTLPTKGVQ